MIKYLSLFFFPVAILAEASPGIVRVQLEQQQIRVEARFARDTEVAFRVNQAHEVNGVGHLVKCNWNWANGVASARFPRFAERRDNAFCRFQLIDKPSGQPLGQARWVANIELAARRTNAFPVARGIKGLQCIEDIDDALRLGIKQAALNVTLDQLVDWRAKSGTFSRQVDGAT